MDYQEKYLKYKTKYLELKNIQVGGNLSMNFDKAINVLTDVIYLSYKLEKVYSTFWKNIYYNDAFVFYKNAIEYYKTFKIINSIIFLVE